MATDPLRQMLDALVADAPELAGRPSRGPELAARAFVSAGHLGRVVRARTGESPAALRRRVLLERAAWQVQRGTPATEAAWDSGFESLEGSHGRSPGPTAGHRAVPESSTGSG